MGKIFVVLLWPTKFTKIFPLKKKFPPYTVYVQITMGSDQYCLLPLPIYHFSHLLLLFLFDVLFLRKFGPCLEGATMLNHRVHYFLYQNIRTHSGRQRCSHLYRSLGIEMSSPTPLELTSCHIATLHLCLYLITNFYDPPPPWNLRINVCPFPSRNHTWIPSLNSFISNWTLKPASCKSMSTL